MSQLVEESPPQELAAGTLPDAVLPEQVATTQHLGAVRNFLCLALHQVLLRIGWIFKTETLIMPAFMDYIGGNEVLRSCLPVLNRMGFSVPQVLFARRLKVLPKKKWVVAIGSFIAAIPFRHLGGGVGERLVAAG